MSQAQDCAAAWEAAIVSRVDLNVLADYGMQPSLLYQLVAWNPQSSKFLQAGDHAAAWEAAIVNRVDLNVLVDYAWPAFLDAAPAFVASVAADSDIADLLAALKPGSVVAADGLYAGMATEVHLNV